MQTLQFIRQNIPWLGAGFLLVFSSSYGQTFFISIFAGEIQSEFSLSHGQWGSIYMIGTLASAFVMLFVGGLTDIFRVRSLSVLVLIALSAACVFMSLNTSALGLIFAVFFLRLFGQGMLSHVPRVGVSRWFVATRGRALAVVSMGISVGEALLPLLFVALIGTIGWRTSWLYAAGFALIIAPIVYVTLKNERTPQSTAQENASPGMNGKHWNRSQMLRHPLFWLTLPSMIGPPTFGTSLFFHQVRLNHEKGWEHIDFVALFPIYTGFSIAIIIISGFLVDRFKAGPLMPIYALPMALSFAIFSYVDTLFGALLGFVFFAFMAGHFSTIAAAFWAEYYGTKHLGSIKSLSTVTMVFGSAIGPGLTGWLIDFGVNFETQLQFIALYFILASIFCWFGIKGAKKHFL